MLKQFSSNNRKVTRAVPKNIKGNTLDNDAYIAYLESIAEAEYAEHNTGIQKTSSNTRKNLNQKQVTNNTNKIKNFRDEIVEFGARYIKKRIDSFDNTGFGLLRINNVVLDYGLEGATPDNFEVLVYGLHIPGDFHIEQLGNDVVIELNDTYIDFDSTTIDDIYVIGKIIELNLDTEDYFDLRTENDENIIL
jgi:hypothetical protein